MFCRQRYIKNITAAQVSRQVTIVLMEQILLNFGIHLLLCIQSRKLSLTLIGGCSTSKSESEFASLSSLKLSILKIFAKIQIFNNNVGYTIIIIFINCYKLFLPKVITIQKEKFKIISTTKFQKFPIFIYTCSMMKTILHKL